jgi:hypothetical protein
MEKNLPTSVDTTWFAASRPLRSKHCGPLGGIGHLLCLAGVTLLFWTGCSRGPAAPPLPSVSPRRAGNEAVALYDADDDGVLKGDEIWETPLLLSQYSLLDANNDKTITASEIADRVRAWQDSPSRIMRASPTVMLDGKPLAGATVTLDPAPFLGPDYPSATAVTDSKGRARFAGQDRRYPGVYLGLYTVRISKLEDGKETIPARYNTKSELSYEISPENWINSVFNWFHLEKDGREEVL